MAEATSPYLRQHGENPVDWWPWGDEAFAEARRRDVQVFLSIGYAACHWCHVMARESFEDPRVAAVMNAHYVCIKVDREERPDVDALYIQALLAMGEPAGWPASLWLSPDAVPLFGGTYFPPDFRYGTPGFGDLLRRMASAWRDGREGLLRGGARVVDALSVQPEAGPLPGPELLARAVDDLVRDWDPAWPGWGPQARFPMPPTLSLLLQDAVARPGGPAKEPLLQLLDAIDRGGLQDHVGGGFHRYCVDPGWEVPHFEKMLFDNAQLVRVFSRAARVFGRPRFAQVVRDTVRWLIDELSDPSTGLFWSSLDADSEGEEGTFYVWRPDQFKALADPELHRVLARCYGLGGPMNFEGHAIVPNRAPGIDPGQPVVRRGLAALKALRDQRPRPSVDDKVVVGWNGLAVAALAEAGAQLGESRWIGHAERVATLLLEARRSDGTLPRTLAVGAPAGVLLDHAAVAEGLLALHAATGEARWLLAARDLALATVAAFGDPARGDFRQSLDGGLLVARRSLDDGAEPSGQGQLLAVLLQLAHLGCEGLAPDVCRRGLESVAVALAREPAAWPSLVVALDDWHRGGVQVVIAASGAEDPALPGLLTEAAQTWVPGRALAVGLVDAPGLVQAFSALAGRTPGPDGARAYVCVGRTCGLPATTPARLGRQLRATAPK